MTPRSDRVHPQKRGWTAKNCLPLGDLDRERIADIDRKLSLKLDASQLAANTANRIRIIARASAQSAMEAGAVAADVWPQRSKTRARRKVARTKRNVDVRALPSPTAMAQAIDPIVRQQPGQTYRGDDRGCLLRRLAAIGGREQRRLRDVDAGPHQPEGLAGSLRL